MLTYMCSILLYESCSPFFQGRGELDVLCVSFEERFNAGSEGLIICGTDGFSGLKYEQNEIRAGQFADCGDALLVERLDFAHVAVCGSDVWFHLLEEGFELGRGHVLIGGQGIRDDARQR